MHLEKPLVKNNIQTKNLKTKDKIFIRFYLINNWTNIKVWSTMCVKLWILIKSKMRKEVKYDTYGWNILRLDHLSRSLKLSSNTMSWSQLYLRARVKSFIVFIFGVKHTVKQNQKKILVHRYHRRKNGSSVI